MRAIMGIGVVTMVMLNTGTIDNGISAVQSNKSRTILQSVRLDSLKAKMIIFKIMDMTIMKRVEEDRLRMVKLCGFVAQLLYKLSINKCYLLPDDGIFGSFRIKTTDNRKSKQL
jgi:hypothetical protein